MSPTAKMPGELRLELLGIDGDQVLVEIEPPVGDGSELHGEPEERQQPVAGIAHLPVLGLDGHRGKRTVVAFERGHLADQQRDLLVGEPAPASARPNAAHHGTRRAGAAG